MRINLTGGLGGPTKEGLFAADHGNHQPGRVVACSDSSGGSSSMRTHGRGSTDGCRSSDRLGKSRGMNIRIGASEKMRNDIAYRWLTACLGLGLYASTAVRNTWHSWNVARYEGFATHVDAVAAGLCQTWPATFFLLPFAAVFIFYGVFEAPSLAVLPKRPQHFSIWAFSSTLLAIAMGGIELSYIVSAFRHPHHVATAIGTVAYLAFVYVWWCTSLTHGNDPSRPNR